MVQYPVEHLNSLPPATRHKLLPSKMLTEAFANETQANFISIDIERNGECM